MKSAEIRQTFLDFFKSKMHEIVPSAPMVVKNDPTLMFNNSGMAPFKDLFLGNAPIRFPRVADTQKCLRVSGKHNDLEEVGVDTYHHTMFEMLGNWSFGDYFKKEAISWAWELLTEVYNIPKDKLYVTVFEGSTEEGLSFDQEAYDVWKTLINEDRILKGNKKDNFWEMGETGPCGPCSEIHVDMRPDSERKSSSGKELVNTGHPQVIEIWNNVFMEFERRADGSLVRLPKKHVDTGMGFERLCMVLQNKQSTYDTDVFTPLIEFVCNNSGKAYTATQSDGNEDAAIRKTDIAIRVLCDHIRTICFAIADGQLPSNNKAGYVIRRILRRAVRYYFTFLDIKEPFLCRMVPVLVKQMGDFFPEIKAQQTLIVNVIEEEETAFLRTLGAGIQMFNQQIKNIDSKIINGKFAFELYDTYGFPVDLTQLMARENDLSVDMDQFNICMAEQKNRSRAASVTDTDDWVVIQDGRETIFTGYTSLSEQVKILRYRQVSAKNKKFYQLVFDQTPFYAESGGQVGDTGFLDSGDNKIEIYDTKKENGVILHFTASLPKDVNKEFKAVVNSSRRMGIRCNHSATHLMHAALRAVLGTHVEQKGSLVAEEHLRFDFSHFSKITDEQLGQIEQMVSEKIREQIKVETKVMPIEEARKTGAMALFGEKYGDEVRVVFIDPSYSVELCGGTHVDNSGQIGLFKITSESAVAAGVRRIEAITSKTAEAFLNKQLQLLGQVKHILKNPPDLIKSIENISEQNQKLQKELEILYREKALILKEKLGSSARLLGTTRLICEQVNLTNPDYLKDICFQLKNEPATAVILGTNVDQKAQLYVALSDDLVKQKGLNASSIIKILAKEINGGGGGQAFYATAGGTQTDGLKRALQKAPELFD